MVKVKGSLIAIEGIDGAGTTTQARLLVDWLGQQGIPAHLTCEPSAGPVGRLLRQLLKGQAPWPMDPAAVALLFAADRVDHYQHEIRPRLEAGIQVVTDRYVYSSLAYQSTTEALSWLESINSMAPEPELTIYVRVDPALAKQRREGRGGSPELYDDLQLQRAISAKYDSILGSAPNQGSITKDLGGSTGPDPAGSAGIAAPRLTSRRPQTAVLDGSLSVDALHLQLRALVEKVAGRSSS